MRIRIIGGLLAAAACFFPACSKDGGSGGDPVRKGAAPAEIERMPGAWLTDDPNVRVSGVGRGEEGDLEIEVSLAPGGKAPQRVLGLNLVLPDGAGAVMCEYRVGAEHVTYRAGDAQLGTTAALNQAMSGHGDRLPLRRLGVVREWAIWRLELPANVWAGARADARAIEGGATVKIRFENTSTENNGRGKAGGAMAELVRKLVVNGEDVERWRTPPAIKNEISDAPTGPRQLAPKATYWARLAVEKDGAVRITPAALAAAGFPEPGAHLGELRVFTEGEEVPAAVVTVGEEENLVFYGWASVSPYDPKQVYWVAYEPGGAPERFEAAGGEGSGQLLETIRRTDRIERDNMLMIHLGEFLDIKKVRWIDARLLLSQPMRVGFDLFEPAAEQGGVDVTTTLVAAEPSRVRGVLQPAVGFMLQRPAELLLTADDPTTNTASLDEGLVHARLPLQMAEEIKVQDRLPVALFSDGPTTIDLRLAIGGGDAGLDEAGRALWLDAIEVGYLSAARPRDGVLSVALDSVTTAGVYRVATGNWGLGAGDLLAFSLDAGRREARRVEPDAGGVTFVVSAELRGEAVAIPQIRAAEIEPFSAAAGILAFDEECDRLFITHSRFNDDLMPLLELDGRRGLRSRVVRIEELYETFSGGMVSPEAIRRYLAHWLRESPATAPGSVLLVGDASSDFLHLTKSDVPNLVPSFSGMIPGESWACDYWFTCVAGEDMLGDFQIGRLSAEKPDDMREVLAKTVKYAETPPGLWRARVGTIADNQTTPSDNFREIAEDVRQRETPPGYADWRIYLDDMPLEDDWYVPQIVFMQEYEERKEWRKTSGAATNAIRNHFNDGTSVLSFYGHGSPNLWTTERIWLGMDSPNRDSQYLDSDGRYAFVINYTCNSGAIDYPMRPYNLCLTEDLLRTTDGGAVALFVPSGEGMNEDQRVLGREMQRTIFADESRAFGELSMLARLRYLAGGHPVYLGYMYNLLGDPTAELQLARRRYALELDRGTARPGLANVTARLGGVDFPGGQSVCWIEDEKGDVLWQSDARAFGGGRIEWPLEIPQDTAAPALLRVSVYAWNEETKRDFLATGELDYLLPRPAIAAARGWSEGGKSSIEVTVKNPEKIETGEFELEILDSRKQVAAAETMQLEAGAEKTVRFSVAGGAGGAQVYEARIARPERSDALNEPRDVSHLIAVLPETEWAGLAPGLGSWEKQQNNAAGVLNIVALSSTTRQAHLDRLVAREGERVLTSTTLTFAPAPSGGQMATVRWAGEALRLTAESFGGRDADIRLDFEHRATTSSTQAEAIDSINLAELPKRTPRLRIVRDSVRVEPERPTDGQTVFVRFRAENAGNLESGKFTPKLYGNDPTTTRTEALNVVSKLPPATYGPLGPDRSVEVQLRWDPIQNQGKQTIWIELHPGVAPSAEARKEQVASHTFYVMSKSNPEFARPVWATFDGEDRLSNRRVLHALVANTGETDARALEVTFYKTREKRPEDVLHVATIPLLAAKSREEVTFVWENFDPNSHPSADMRLKGSQQRIHD